MPNSKKTPVEVLISLRKTPDIAAGEAHVSQRLAFDLLSLQSEGYTGKKLLEVVAKKSLHEIAEPIHTNMQDILLCFGAGTAVLHTESKTVDVHPRVAHSSDPLDKEKARSLTQAKQVLQPVYILQVYLDIVSDQMATDQRPEEILKRMKGIRTDIQHKSWEDIEQSALKTLFASTSLYTLFPELRDKTISDTEKKIFLTHSLVRDAKLRIILARNMLQIKERLQHMPQIEIFEEEELLIKRKEEEIKQQHHEVKVIINYIQQYIPHMHAADMIKLQEFLRDQDVTEAGLRYEIEQIIAHTFGISSVMLKDLKDKTKLEQEIQQLEQKIHDPSLVGTPDEEVQKMKETLKNKRTELETRYADPELDSHRADMDQIQGLFEKEKTEEHPNGFLHHVMKKIIGFDGKIKEYDRQLSTLHEKEQSASKKQLRIRLQEEAGFIDQLSAVLDQSLIQFMVAKYNEVTISLQQRMEAMDEEREKQLVLAHSHTQDEAKKEFFLNPLEQQEMKDLHAISATLRERWVTFDIRSRQHTVRTDTIKSDLLTILYQGEDGFRSLIQHAIGIPEAEELATVDKKRIDTIVRMKGKYMKRKLLRDFFISRVLRGGQDTQAGNVSLTVSLRDHEWELFIDVFDDEMNDGIQSSQEAKRLMYYLEGKGIKPHPKVKWLTYALVILKAGFFGHHLQPLLLEEHTSSQPKQILKSIE